MSAMSPARAGCRDFPFAGAAMSDDGMERRRGI